MGRYESVELNSDFFRGQKIQMDLDTKGRREGKKCWCHQAEALSVLKGLQISYRNVWMTSQIKIAERG